MSAHPVHANPAPGLDDRLAQVERELSRWRRGAAGLMAVGVLSAIVIGAGRDDPKPGVVEATRFVLLDEAGRKRGAFGTGAKGSPGLVLADAEGRFRGAFGLTSDGRPYFRLDDERGKIVTSAAQHEDGSSALWLGSIRDPVSGRISLSTSRDGRSMIDLGHGESTRVTLSSSDNDANIKINREDDSSGVNLYVHDGDPRITLTDQNNKIQMLQAVSNSGSAFLLGGSGDAARLRLQVAGGVEAVTLSDEGGRNRVALSAGPGQLNGLAVNAEDGRLSAWLGQVGQGSPMLRLLGQGKPGRDFVPYLELEGGVEANAIRVVGEAQTLFSEP